MTEYCSICGKPPAPHSSQFWAGNKVVTLRFFSIISPKFLKKFL